MPGAAKINSAESWRDLFMLSMELRALAHLIEMQCTETPLLDMDEVCAGLGQLLSCQAQTIRRVFQDIEMNQPGFGSKAPSRRRRRAA